MWYLSYFCKIKYNLLIKKDKEGGIFSFGRNNYGELGLNRDSYLADTPHEVTFFSDKNIIDIKCGGAFTLALSGIFYLK